MVVALTRGRLHSTVIASALMRPRPRLSGCGSPTIQSTLPGARRPSSSPSSRSSPSAGRDLFHGVGGKKPGARSGREIHGHRDQARRIQPRLHRHRPRGSRVEREVPARSQHRDRRLAASSGASAITSRRSICFSEWTAEKATSPNPQLPARFREKKPDLNGLDAGDPWSYYQNPFVGTRQLNGLLALQAMLGNSDLKDAQNVIYTLEKRARRREALVCRARPWSDVRPDRGPRCAARRHRGLRGDSVHPRRRERQGPLRLPRPAQGAVRQHHARPTCAGSVSGSTA